MKAIFTTLLAGCALVGFASGQSAGISPIPAPTTPVIQIGRGMNLGSMLEESRDGDWNAAIHEDYFPIIRQAGFTLIRVPISWTQHVSPAPDYAIDPAFLSRVDWVVAQAQKNDLQAILDYHNDGALMYDPAANADRFIAIWKQVAEHYKNAPSSILFELLNEPNKKLDVPQWNDLLERALAAVRATKPARPLVNGPGRSNRIDQLQNLVLPDGDSHLLVTVHFYDPMSFTHQGAQWVKDGDAWLGNTWKGTDAEKLAVTAAFDKAAEWGRAHHRPIFLGEFGAYHMGDIDSRTRWISFVARTAESHGFSWAYWEFSHGFGVYDPEAHAWREPLLEALMPK